MQNDELRNFKPKRKRQEMEMVDNYVNNVNSSMINKTKCRPC